MTDTPREAPRHDWKVVDSDGSLTELSNVPEPTEIDDWVRFYDPTTPGEYEENEVALFYKPRSVIRRLTNG